MKPLYPYDEMEIGDSFRIPDKPLHVMKQSAKAASKRLRRQFIVWVEDDGGVRVQRVVDR